MASELNSKIKLNKKIKEKKTFQIMANIKFFPFFSKKPLITQSKLKHTAPFSAAGQKTKEGNSCVHKITNGHAPFFLGVCCFVLSPRMWKTYIHFLYFLRGYLNLHVMLVALTTNLKTSLKLGSLHNPLCLNFI